MYRKIILCIDDSPLDEQVVRTGADLACRYNAQVVLFSILDPARLPTQPYTGLEAVQMLDRHSRSLSQNSHRFSAFLHDRGIRSQSMQLTGNSAKTILAAAENEAADLIVVGTHARGRIQAWLSSDVWSEVSHKASCQVLRVTPSSHHGSDRNASSGGSASSNAARRFAASLSAL